jgi:DNA-binding LacI/PurR family transcriptional regulator/signal transduction histidine kinase/ActR/RegA family two-component response regulator
MAYHGRTKFIVPGNDVVPGRLTIAVLLDHLNFFGRGYEGQLRDALHTAARAKGHNLICLYGGALGSPNRLEAADNTIYELAQKGTFDGVIAVAALLSSYCGAESVERLLAGYRGKPLCSVGLSFPEVPSLVLDNSGGIEQTTLHLVHEHGCRRLAFLAGTPKNPEAEDRFAGFRAVLERSGLALDPALFAHGHFLPSLGREAMDAILDRGVPFDAVVCANDSMALGAIQALRHRGRRVPQDVAVTGFDDLTLARLANPPLTTIAQPFDMFAHLAIDSIEVQVANRPVQWVTNIPSQFVRRQSCGCGYRAHQESSDMLPMLGVVAGTLLHEQVGALQPIVAEILSSAGEDGQAAASCLIQGLQAEASGEPEAFTLAVSSVLMEVADDSERHRSLQSAINRLRNELADLTDLRLERAFYDGLSMVALTNPTSQVQHRLALEESYARVISVGELASAALDLGSLRESLVRGLPAAGVRTAFLSCLLEEDPAIAQSVACILDGEVHESKTPRFSAGDILPPDIARSDRVGTFLVFPLTHEQRLLGVVAFAHLDGNHAYLAFRNQIAAVINSIRLHQEVVRKTMLHERSMQERIATTKRMEALSVLAGGVAHDLNNALGPLVVLPDVILDSLDLLPIDETTATELRNDVESIKTAALRAAQTIKDLLTLGRQGRMAKTELDVNRLVRSCLNDGPWHQNAAGAPQITLHAELASEPLTIQGADSQLARAISNLVRNAVEAIDSPGQVTVRTSHVRLEEPFAGFETIPAGVYVRLSISDTGCGIPPQDLSRVFEPFFTKKRAGEYSGTGLGLAIVHGVLKEHAGFIDLTSTQQAGTTFSLYFPAQRPPQPLELSRATAPHGHARILLVDDEAVQLRTTRRVLTRLGYTVETAASGKLACEMFQQVPPTGPSPFDIVLVDMLLGESLDGLQIIDQIRSLFPSQKAIIISGHAPNERADQAIKQGLIWVAKPYDIETLAQAVASTLTK